VQRGHRTGAHSLLAQLQVLAEARKCTAQIRVAERQWVQLRPQAAMKRVSLEGDFLDFAQFPELVILDPFGFASFLQQT
jgi:hypothetical protein